MNLSERVSTQLGAWRTSGSPAEIGGIHVIIKSED